jgi:predicted phosphohydrolase
MTQQPAIRGEAALPSVSSITDARKLADGMLKAMNELLELIERETTLVRAGKIADAMRLETQKTELSKRYVSHVSLLKGSHLYMKRTTPDLLTALERHHETFRAMLQVNLTVLATAHAISEAIIRGVNAEVQKKRAPSTYTAAGNPAKPNSRNATPFAVSRTL